jgi:cytoskeleton protein RodZ
MNEFTMQAMPAPEDTGAGKRLRAAREQQGLSVAEAAAQLKLSTRQIEALESDSYDKLPGTIFVRGFLRSYARLLKLDPTPLLAAADQKLRPPPPQPENTASAAPFPAPRTRSWRWYALAAAALILLVPLIYEAFFVLPAGRSEGPRENAGPISLPPVTSQENTVAEPPLTPAVNSDRASPAPDAAAAAPAPTSAPQSSSSRQQRRVKFMFDKDSWVEIRDRTGAIVFSQLNRAGSEQSVVLNPPVSIVVGNAAGVRMTYDDASYDLRRHIKVDVARFALE